MREEEEEEEAAEFGDEDLFHQQVVGKGCGLAVEDRVRQGREGAYPGDLA